jgi:hypothetical protein
MVVIYISTIMISLDAGISIWAILRYIWPWSRVDGMISLDAFPEKCTTERRQHDV